MKRVVVVGGGIAGLAVALRIRDGGADLPGGVDVRVLEAGDRPGGNLRTDRFDGWTVEWGPNGFLDNVPSTLELVSRLGLEDRLVRADEAAARRFLYRNGRLHEVPTGPASFLRSPLLSPRGRLRVLGEPFASGRPEGVDETVHGFAARRIGAEAADILVDAMVSGVFAGDARKLSLRSTFPKMAAMEAEHGSLVRAMVARRRAGGSGGGPAGPGGTLTSLDEGIEMLPEALAAELGPSIDTGLAVDSVVTDDVDPAAGPTWSIRTVEGDELFADAVVLAVPAPAARSIVAPVDAGLGALLAEIPHAGLAVVALGYDRDDLSHPLDGFGFLVPRGEGLRILGCLWDSSVFPRRAPDGRVLIRAMVGGASDPSAVDEPDERLLASVLDDLAGAGLRGRPRMTRIYRHRLGIGQYTVGHDDRLARIGERLRLRPGLFLAGSSYFGVSMNLCVAEGNRVAGEVLGFLRAPRPGQAGAP